MNELSIFLKDKYEKAITLKNKFKKIEKLKQNT